MRDRGRTHAFVFGTRLTNITRSLRYRNPDIALAEVSRQVKDWDGGTRIGRCIASFNRNWSRRVLARGAIVVLVSDGLDRENSADLDGQMERLHKSCARLVWLNPLLRYPEFAPKAAGIRAILPHVDEFRPAHDLASVAALAASLSLAHSWPAGRRRNTLR